VELIDLPDFGPDDYAAIEDGEADPYQTDDLGISWREKSGHVGLTEGGRLIAHAGWVPVEGRTASGEPVGAIGLGGVMVHRRYRGRGMGRRVVSAAMNRMRALDTPLGLLFCRPDRVPFYESLGWAPLQATVSADQPTGPVEIPLVTCWTALGQGASAPTTDLHIDGLPF
jgi:GNAT superfamily N-acetyltransferase